MRPPTEKSYISGEIIQPTCLNWSPQRVPLTSQQPDWVWCLWTWLSLCAELGRISRTPPSTGDSARRSRIRKRVPIQQPSPAPQYLSCLRAPEDHVLGVLCSSELQLQCQQRVWQSQLLPLHNLCLTAVCVSWWKCYAQQGLLLPASENCLEDLRITTDLLTTTIHQPFLYALRNSSNC